MVWQGKPDTSATLEHSVLHARDVPDMLALTAATQPGPFGLRTIELGDYLGVRKEGKLAASGDKVTAPPAPIEKDQSPPPHRAHIEPNPHPSPMRRGKPRPAPPYHLTSR